ncbi:MAG: sugar O-acyltransferase [Deltaproteobacteria bacterium]|jgi:sugar O-acyltransferase (sialic acid O-acetyltransferase NeuD family)|nr:sugar O-acyltransferase [Deltaproteobacteria bacterium]
MILGIYGSGGAGRETKDIAETVNAITGRWEQILFIDDVAPAGARAGLERIGFKELCGRVPPDTAVITIAVGEPADRKKLAARVLEKGYRLESIVSPLASVSPDSSISPGAVVYPGVFIGPGCVIGGNCFIMSGVAVCHDSALGSHSVCACGVKIAGNCLIGESAYLGLNACVKEKTTIGGESIVGMGAVVMSDVPSGVIVCGIPACIIKNNTEKKVFKKA